MLFDLESTCLINKKIRKVKNKKNKKTCIFKEKSYLKFFYFDIE